MVRMMSRLREAPAGRVTQVFKDGAEQQAAYDFLESTEVSAEALRDGVHASTARASREEPFVFVPLDGTSLTLVDRAKKKDFGAIGRNQLPTRGVKAITAVAVSADGAPIGLAGSTYWARPVKTKAQRRGRKKQSVAAGQTEMKHWRSTVASIEGHFLEHAPETARWYVMDREADSANLLEDLLQQGALFTIRSRHNRHVHTALGARARLTPIAQKAPLVGTRFVEVPAGPHRAARRAVLDLRCTNVTLMLPDYARPRHPKACPLTVVLVRERHPPRGEKPIEWRLLTNVVVETLERAELVVRSYATRWRIEEVHRTWKSGGCNVEDTQLRSRAAVMKWATLLAAVATDIERLKYLARTQPEDPASVALSPLEIEVLILAKRKIAKRTETIADAMPSIAQAVRWIADLGGYTGKSSGGPPGSITIGRGLASLRLLVEGVALARGHAE